MIGSLSGRTAEFAENSQGGEILLLGILSDTHNEVGRTKVAVETLRSEGAEALIHCGDLSIPEIVGVCSILPFYFVFGNHDSDMVPYLQAAAEEFSSTCLGWGGEIELAGKRIAVVHGHLRMDLKPLLEAEPDYLFSGHAHYRQDWREGKTRRINPGALFRAEEFTLALLDLANDELRFLSIDD